MIEIEIVCPCCAQVVVLPKHDAYGFVLDASVETAEGNTKTS